MKNKFTGSKASAFDADALRLCMEGCCTEGSSAEKKVEDVMQKVTSACDVAMPRRGNGNPHKPVYWWRDRIAQLRAKCHKARRLSQRVRGKPIFPELEEKFKLARSKLNKAIKHSNRQGWTELLGVVDEDPWEDLSRSSWLGSSVSQDNNPHASSNSRRSSALSSQSKNPSAIK